MQSHLDNVSVDAGFDTLDYSFSPVSSSGLNPAIYGERGLWCAVIEQAISDLESVAESREARHWLLRDNQDFPLVCNLAGLSPVAVRRAVLEKCKMLLKVA